MSNTVVFSAPPAGLFAALPGALHQAGFTIRSALDADMLINLAEDADSALEAASAFKARQMPGSQHAQERLVVNVLPPVREANWESTKNAATLWAFTRHAALAWAEKGIRVNALGIGAIGLNALPPQELQAHQPGRSLQLAPPEEIAETILAMWRWRSMTGQLIRLCA